MLPVPQAVYRSTAPQRKSSARRGSPLFLSGANHYKDRPLSAPSFGHDAPLYAVERIVEVQGDVLVIATVLTLTHTCQQRRWRQWDPVATWGVVSSSSIFSRCLHLCVRDKHNSLRIAFRQHCQKHMRQGPRKIAFVVLWAAQSRNTEVCNRSTIDVFLLLHFQWKQKKISRMLRESVHFRFGQNSYNKIFSEFHKAVSM